MMLAASSPDVFWMACLALMVYQTWRGWRTGLARQLVSVAGLLLGWIIGKTQGPAFVARHFGGAGLPSFIVVPFVSLVLGLIVYLAAVLAGWLLFKRASDRSFGPTRLVFGVGGAVIAFFIGLFSIWVTITAIRLTGALLEPPDEIYTDASAATLGVPPDSHGAPTPAAAASSTATTTTTTATTPKPGTASGGVRPVPPRRTSRALASYDPAATPLAHLRDALDSGITGEIVHFTDPFGAAVYLDLNKIGVIISDPRLLQRLLEAPGMHDVSADPKWSALREDPTIPTAIQNRDVLSLIRNPRLAAACKDQRLAKRLDKVDLTRVLNETIPSAHD